MLGPVFSLELQLAVRRGRLHAARRLYAGWWVLQAVVLFVSFFLAESNRASSPANLGPVLSLAFQVFVTEHFIFLVLATPAFVAGGIADEKSQGTLQHLLTADLTSGEIVLGKFLGRMAQVGLLALISWPFIGLVGGFGHLGGPVLLATLLVTSLVFFVLGAASVWASLRSKQTSQAVLRVYAWSALAILAIGGTLQGIAALSWRYKMGSPVQQRLSQLEKWLVCLDPLSVLDSVWGQDDLREFWNRFQVMLLVYGGMGMIFLALAVWRFRPLCLRQVEAAGRTGRSWWKRQRRGVDEDPIRWHEATMAGRLPRWLGYGLLGGLTAGCSLAINYSADPRLFLIQGVVFLFLASLVAGIRASGAVSGERERQTWESLLLTPLDTADLVIDKVHGTLDALRPYFLAFAIPALVLALRSGFEAVVFVLSCLLLTWTAMYYMAATGIWCSVRCKGSWRSLVATLTSGYGYLLAILLGFAVFFLWASCGIGALVGFFLRLAGVTSLASLTTLTVCVFTSLGVSWVLWRASYPKLDRARAWVDEYERYGRTFVRSLASALRKHYQLREKRHGEEHGARQSHLVSPPRGAGK